MVEFPPIAHQMVRQQLQLLLTAGGTNLCIWDLMR
jgi:hypothetical protein